MSFWRQFFLSTVRIQTPASWPSVCLPSWSQMLQLQASWTLFLQTSSESALLEKLTFWEETQISLTLAKTLRWISPAKFCWKIFVSLQKILVGIFSKEPEPLHPTFAHPLTGVDWLTPLQDREPAADSHQSRSPTQPGQLRSRCPLLLRCQDSPPDLITESGQLARLLPLDQHPQKHSICQSLDLTPPALAAVDALPLQCKSLQLVAAPVPELAPPQAHLTLVLADVQPPTQPPFAPPIAAAPLPLGQLWTSWSASQWWMLCRVVCLFF